MISKIIHSILSVVYPPTCKICDSPLLVGEQDICLHCINQIPLTRLSIEGNKAEKLFWGIVDIEKVYSFMYYEKGSNYAHLIHQLKYKGDYKLGLTLGKLMATHAHKTFFDTIDILIPIPIHAQKLKQRGYNQAEWLCKGIQLVYPIAIRTDLIAKSTITESQTTKGVYERRCNTDHVFTLINKEDLIGKHVLLVDDVLTTGSTLISCSLLLKEVENIKISIITASLTYD